MLLTLDVPLDARAQRFALEAALGSGCPLMLYDAVPVGPNSPRPLSAATTLCAQRGVGLLVFGPSRAAAGRWRYRSWSRRVRRDTPCLLWLPEG